MCRVARVFAIICATSLIEVTAASVDGVISGVLTVDGKPATGVEVALVEVNSGAIKRVRSGRGGAFEARLPPGDYVAATGSAVRSAIGQAPTRVSVRAGRVERLTLKLVTPPAPSTPARAGQTATAATDPFSAITSTSDVLFTPSQEPAPPPSRACCKFRRDNTCPPGCACCCTDFPKCCKTSPPGPPTCP